MNQRSSIRALDVIFVVLVVLIGFLAFFIGFLVAPLIVMALAYAVLVIVDRRHHHHRSRSASQPLEPQRPAYMRAEQSRLGAERSDDGAREPVATKE